MAISIKGKGKALAISIVVVAVLMMTAGSLAASSLKGDWPTYVFGAIFVSYSVWFANYFNNDKDKDKDKDKSN